MLEQAQEIAHLKRNFRDDRRRLLELEAEIDRLQQQGAKTRYPIAEQSSPEQSASSKRGRSLSSELEYSLPDFADSPSVPSKRRRLSLDSVRSESVPGDAEFFVFEDEVYHQHDDDVENEQSETADDVTVGLQGSPQTAAEAEQSVSSTAHLQQQSPIMLSKDAQKLRDMCYLAWDVTEDEEETFQGFCEAIFGHGRTFQSVQMAIDKFCHGPFDKPAEDPPGYLMAKMNGKPAGAGNAHMTSKTCKWCQGRRMCVWARFATGVASGYGQRVRGVVPKGQRDHDSTTQPQTVDVNGR